MTTAASQAHREAGTRLVQRVGRSAGSDKAPGPDKVGMTVSARTTSGSPGHCVDEPVPTSATNANASTRRDATEVRGDSHTPTTSDPACADIVAPDSGRGRSEAQRESGGDHTVPHHP